MDRIDAVLEQVIGQLTAENRPELLRSFAWLCGVAGGYKTFRNESNNGIGLRCLACGEQHPFQRHRVTWLRQNADRRFKICAR